MEEDQIDPKETFVIRLKESWRPALGDSLATSRSSLPLGPPLLLRLIRVERYTPGGDGGRLPSPPAGRGGL